MPEQPYVKLMLQVLAQSRVEHYQNENLLQLTLWLTYRVLDINPRCAEAYLVLAYFFCLLGESDRAYRVLLHHVQAYRIPHTGIDAFLTLLSPQSSLEAVTLTPAEVSEGLPSLQDTLQRFARVPAVPFAHNVQVASPALSRLAELVKGMEA